ncbi:Ig domain-containing protein [Acetobacterium woodii]|uniref:Clostridial hydrophobic W n=1 Tax=Acetobacterium woodii (strain ATCC 29683 / DSM 1030 / JCM 2381 / KCTC 1655 / WB1) TaxID=931626 RepID=H6LCD8_ACEWD|nr:Ig domain-containing protein [Acetobacterium woodii]AFA50253.1 hypothetical protein Awo_c35290 [Acetobacterium woodii DSM 1030]
MKKKLTYLMICCLFLGVLFSGNVFAEDLAVEQTKNVKYATHVQNEGWQDWKYDGVMSGTSGRGLRLEGIRIETVNNADLGIEYSTHVQNYGWQGFKANGIMSGTSGEGLRLEAIRIRLTGTDAANYDVWYHVHAQNVGWMGWTKNGADSGTAGYGYRLEGIEIKILPKGSDAPGTTENAYLSYGFIVEQTGFQTYEDYDGTISSMLFCSFVNNTSSPVKITDISFSLKDADDIVLGTSSEVFIDYAPEVIMPGQRGFAVDSAYKNYYKIASLDEPKSINVRINTREAQAKDMIGILNASNASIALGKDDYATRVVCLVENPTNRIAYYNTVVAGLYDSNNQLIGCLYDLSDSTIIGPYETAKYSLDGWMAHSSLFQNAVKAEAAGKVNFYEDETLNIDTE